MTEGHAIIVPRRHIEPGKDKLEDAEAVAIEHEIECLQSCMHGSIAMKGGVDIFQKTRIEVPEGYNGTKMDHWHIHVLPSKPGDELYGRGIRWGEPGRFLPLTPDEAARMQEILRV